MNYYELSFTSFSNFLQFYVETIVIIKI